MRGRSRGSSESSGRAGRPAAVDRRVAEAPGDAGAGVWRVIVELRGACHTYGRRPCPAPSPVWRDPNSPRLATDRDARPPRPGHSGAERLQGSKHRVGVGTRPPIRREGNRASPLTAIERPRPSDEESSTVRMPPRRRLSRASSRSEWPQRDRPEETTLMPLFSSFGDRAPSDAGRCAVGDDRQIRHSSCQLSQRNLVTGYCRVLVWRARFRFSRISGSRSIDLTIRAGRPAPPVSAQSKTCVGRSGSAGPPAPSPVRGPVGDEHDRASDSVRPARTP